MCLLENDALRENETNNVTCCLLVSNSNKAVLHLINRIGIVVGTRGIRGGRKDAPPCSITEPL